MPVPHALQPSSFTSADRPAIARRSQWLGRWPRTLVTVIAILAMLLSASAASAGDPTPSPAAATAGTTATIASAPAPAAKCMLGCTSVSRCRPQDQCWLISTRDIECVASGDDPPLAFFVQDAIGQWHDSDVATFATAVGSGRTRFWVHGYKIDAAKALVVGAAAHDALVDAEEPPLQFVTWSWPAEREGFQIPDIRRKACRTVTEAYCLAWLWRKLNPQAEISLAGYSYGARIVTGTLHMSAGGTIGDLTLGEDTRSAPSNVRAVLLAASVDHDALAEQGIHGRALVATESMLSIYTSTDKVLKWYHVAVNDRDSQALGYVGIAQLPPPSGHENKFTQMEVSKEIGNVHDWEAYLGNRSVTAAARDTLHHKTAVAAAVAKTSNGVKAVKETNAAKHAPPSNLRKAAAAVTPVRAAERGIPHAATAPR